jgi:hypothetical protein
MFVSNKLMKAFFAYTILCTINMMLCHICSIDGAPNLFKSCNAKSSTLSVSIQSSGNDLYDSNKPLFQKKRRIQSLHMNSNPQILTSSDSNKPLFQKKRRIQSLHMNSNPQILTSSDSNNSLKVKSKISTRVIQYTSSISNAIRNQLIRQRERRSSFSSSTFFTAGKRVMPCDLCMYNWMYIFIPRRVSFYLILSSLLWIIYLIRCVYTYFIQISNH